MVLSHLWYNIGSHNKDDILNIPYYLNKNEITFLRGDNAEMIFCG